MPPPPKPRPVPWAEAAASPRRGLGWIRRWGVSLCSLGLGVATLLVFRRGLPHVGWIVGYLLLLVLLVAAITELRQPLEERGQRRVLGAAEYAVQTLYHGLLLFVLPAYWASATVDAASGLITRGGATIGVEVDGQPCVGFPTPSRKLEFYSKTLEEWKWPEYALPAYIRSHVHWSAMDRAQNEFLLLPTFRLPTLIHTRSGNAKWLYEISHSNPLWLHPKDAERLGVRTNDLLKVHTEIGWFVDKTWVTESIRPGVIACSHHLGRWRLAEETGGERWSTALVNLESLGAGKWRLRQIHGIRPFASDDPDSGRVFWEDAGVHQNLTFPVQPDPVSGQHCWHQKVRVERPGVDDRYGDVVVDTQRAHEVYRRWLALARPAPGPGNLRRPLWLPRAYKPDPSSYRMED